ncbi:NAD(P)-binding protein [Glonium stellatum]|uniref:NAD(P)-binding protein n=1 Tax=Glonium stellatum TaxID=574774 RepID=A0A8E2JSL3_9PEZI|nr:NAD(P)-binding protein [Glonium stellatum]
MPSIMCTTMYINEGFREASSNAGLGFRVVEALCQSPMAYTILLGGRNLKKAKDAVQVAQSRFPESPSIIKAVQIDIEDDGSISGLFEHVSKEYGRLDVLVNNAFDQQLAQGVLTMREMWNKSWNVNTTGTYIVTHTFMPLLLKSTDPRVIFMMSGTSTLAETENPLAPMNESPPKGWPKQAHAITAYRSSKTGLNMMMREWARILKEDGVKVWCVSPGFLATGLGDSQDMNKQMGAQDPSLGARDEDVGKAMRRDSVQSW